MASSTTNKRRYRDSKLGMYFFNSSRQIEAATFNFETFQQRASSQKTWTKFERHKARDKQTGVYIVDLTQLLKWNRKPISTASTKLNLIHLRETVERHRRPNVPEFWQKPTKIDPMINSVPIREDRISMPHFRGHFIAPLKCPLLGNLNHNGAMEVNLSFKIGCNTGAAQVSAKKEV
ncbi:hypothetical protein ACFE04_008339 [Oxalis oulophora]